MYFAKSIFQNSEGWLSLPLSTEVHSNTSFHIPIRCLLLNLHCLYLLSQSNLLAFNRLIKLPPQISLLQEMAPQSPLRMQARSSDYLAPKPAKFNSTSYSNYASHAEFFF